MSGAGFREVTWSDGTLLDAWLAANAMQTNSATQDGTRRRERPRTSKPVCRRRASRRVRFARRRTSGGTRHSWPQPRRRGCIRFFAIGDTLRGSKNENIRRYRVDDPADGAATNRYSGERHIVVG
jgi:hypothetical protein